MMINKDLDKFVKDQLSVWHLANKNFRALKAIETRTLNIRGLELILQHNPARIISSTANADKQSKSSSKCPLCADNRSSEQIKIEFEGRHNHIYDILINPYPIFPRHLVVASKLHENQTIVNRLGDLADLSHHYRDFTFFYNGPNCGASLPGHLHFQAAPRLSTPLEKEVDAIFTKIHNCEFSLPKDLENKNIILDDLDFISSYQEAELYKYKHFTRGIFVMRSKTSASLESLFKRLIDNANVVQSVDEAMINLFIWYAPTSDILERPMGYTHGLADFEYRAIVIFRSKHRSFHYYLDNDRQLTMSPGCADMAGLLIVPKKEDYLKINENLLTELLDDVVIEEKHEQELIYRMQRKQSLLNVGIMSAKQIDFEILSDGIGTRTVYIENGKLSYMGQLYDELFFDAKTSDSLFAQESFILHSVTIGRDFHWERQQCQSFAGSLKFVVDKDKILAINIIGLEDYLLSVISSEMKSTASLEYLKAHCIISRSWLISQIKARKSYEKGDGNLYMDINLHTLVQDEKDYKKIFKYFDRQEHQLFDVCADDHCQRYQGLSMVVGQNVKKAVDATWGQVLVYDNQVCDTRFSKCCGGRSELFSSVWADKDYNYLQSLPDSPGHKQDLEAFCDTKDKNILSQVLNDYDLETEDFYQWTISYKIEEISDIISRKSGIDIGRLLDIKVLKRSQAGRIILLAIIGDKDKMLVSKELMIRKILSPTHLKSAIFDIELDSKSLTLRGRAWGHGVGLCQIGAAVMSSKGYKYDEILEHYYPQAELRIWQED